MSRQRLKYLVDINRRTLGEDTDPEYEFKYIDIGAVGRGSLVAAPEALTFSDAPSRARRLVQEGDTIISTVRTYLRAVMPIRCPTDDLVVSTGFAVLSPRPDMDPRYLGWLAQSDIVVEEVVSRSVGVSYPAINASEIGDIAVPIPPVATQKAIADFIDTETARIDALVTAKRRVVALFQERSIALIEHQARDFAWESVPLRRVIRRIEQGWSPQCEARVPDNDEWGVLKVGCVVRGEFKADEIKALPPDLPPRSEYLVNDGDLLMSRANTRDLVGNTAVVSGVRPRTLLCDKLYRIHLDEHKAIPAFVSLWLQTRAARGQLEVEATGASDSMQNIGQDTVQRVLLPLPSLEQQRAFVNRCEQQRAHGTRVASSIQQQISLLQEHRQALITAAVAGGLEIPGTAV